MAEDRLEKTRAAYRCNRAMVIVAWPHCDCRGCDFARLMLKRMRAGVAPDGLPYGAPRPGVVRDWFEDPSLAAEPFEGPTLRVTMTDEAGEI